MAHCKYHPLESATYNCHKCGTYLCDGCTGPRSKRGDVQCLFCGRDLESIGTAGSATPFWRRLEESFRYPLNWNAMPIILVVALVSSILSALPLFWLFSAIVYLALLGALLKYAFLCLETTAEGEMSAPAPHDAYSGGLNLLIKLICLLVIAIGSITALGNFFGAAIAGLIATAFVVSLPTILIQFAQSDDIWQSLNPLNSLSMITSIGLPYGLLIAFILIMISSVGVIHELIGSRLSFLSVILQSVVSNYYTIVVFHLMGYMLYQYQEQLGYSARADDRETDRDDLSILISKIDVHIKEGYYNEAVKFSEEGIETYPQSFELAQQYFQFSINSKRMELIETSADHLLNVLLKQNKLEQANVIFTRTTKAMATFKPSNADTRLQIAKMCQSKGDAKSALRLLNGLPSYEPQFSKMADVYFTLAKALSDLNLKEKSSICYDRAKAIEKSKRLKTAKTPSNNSLEERFAAKDLSRPTNVDDSSLVSAQQLAEVERINKTEELPPIEFKP